MCWCCLRTQAEVTLTLRCPLQHVVCIGAAGGNVACVLGLAGELRKRSMLTLDVCVGDGGGLA